MVNGVTDRANVRRSLDTKRQHENLSTQRAKLHGDGHSVLRPPPKVPLNALSLTSSGVSGKHWGRGAPTRNRPGTQFSSHSGPCRNTLNTYGNLTIISVYIFP